MLYYVEKITDFKIITFSLPEILGFFFSFFFNRDLKQGVTLLPTKKFKFHSKIRGK